MPTARQIFDHSFLEMRWRVLSLAADFDRLQRAASDGTLPDTDDRLVALRAALQRIASPDIRRAEAVQMLFSDLTPGPTEAENPPTPQEPVR